MLRVLPVTKEKNSQPYLCETGSNMGGKTRNSAIQLVLQQRGKTGFTFLLPVLL